MKPKTTVAAPAFGLVTVLDRITPVAGLTFTDSRLRWQVQFTDRANDHRRQSRII